MNVNGKTLCRYILPATGGLCVTYLYNVVDGIFVGQGVGAAALGAVNLAVPFITSVVAIAAMFPMGGATVVAIRMGRGDQEGANRAFMTAFALTLLASVALMLVGMCFAQEIADLSGAARLSGGMRTMAADYLFYYTAFSVPMLMSTCLSVFVRNDGSPALSFVGMGVVGAAIASGLGQVASVLVLLTHFLRKKGRLRFCRFPVDPALIGKLCKRGLPEAVSQLNTPVTALCYNLVLANLMGDLGVSTFSVLSYLSSLANAILSSVAQGLQPLWGNCYGRRDTEGLRRLFRSGLAVNLAASAVIWGLLCLFDRPIIQVFSPDADLVRTAAGALPLFSLSFLPMALNLVCTAFLFSTKRTLPASVIDVSRGIVVKALAIFALPALLGSGAIWSAPLAAEVLTLLLASLLLRSSRLVYR